MAYKTMSKAKVLAAKRKYLADVRRELLRADEASFEVRLEYEDIRDGLGRLVGARLVATHYSITIET